MFFEEKAIAEDLLFAHFYVFLDTKPNVLWKT